MSMRMRPGSVDYSGSHVLRDFIFTDRQIDPITLANRYPNKIPVSASIEEIRSQTTETVKFLPGGVGAVANGKESPRDQCENLPCGQ